MSESALPTQPNPEPTPTSDRAKQGKRPASGKTKLKRVLSVVLVLAVAVGVRFAVKMFSDQRHAAKAASQIVDAMSEEIDFPQRVDEITTITRITAKKDVVTYHYDFDTSVRPDDMDENMQRRALLKSNCSSTVKPALEEGVKIKHVYSYKGASAEPLSIQVGIKDC
jgi:flagellar basal body-associated protein FliL